MNEKPKNTFVRNSRYFTISVYVVIVVIISAFFIKAIVSWDKTREIIDSLLVAVSPFLIGLFIAFILNPFVKTIDGYLLTRLFHMKKRRIKNLISIFLSYIIFIGLIIMIFVYLIPQVVTSLTDIVVSIQVNAPKLIDYLNNLESKHPDLDFKMINQIVNDSIPSITSILQSTLGGLAGTLYNVGRSVISWILNIIIAIMVSCYMLLDKRHLYIGIKRIIYAFFPKSKAMAFSRTMRECSNIFTNFVVGKTIDSLIIGILCLILMSILRLDYSLLISLIVGITNMIPYFGPFIGAIPGALILIMVSPKQMLIFLVLILVLQQFDGLFLGPKILGNSTGLRPLWIIFAITLGGWVAGPVGMFLGVPVMAVISYLVEKMVDRKLEKNGIQIPIDPGEKIGSGTDYGESSKKK